MLALPSLELARAHRRHHALLSCRTNSLEVAIASIRAAELEKIPLLLALDATVPTSAPHHALLSVALELGRDASVPVIVEVIVAPDRRAASWWLTYGVLAVTLSGDREAIKRVFKDIQGETRAHGAEIGVEPLNVGSVAEAEALGRTLTPTFIRMLPRERISEMREYVTAFGVPVVAGALHGTPRKSRELTLAGCAGVTLDSELHEAYTAGLRTALRSRTVTDPARYLGYGATAVQELVRAYSNYFRG